jgi:hypothetical protein
MIFFKKNKIISCSGVFKSKWNELYNLWKSPEGRSQDHAHM